MASLCKHDAGLRVYQQAQLSAINRHADGTVKLQMPMKLSDGWSFNRIGEDEFRLERKDEVLNDGKTHDGLYSNGRLVRNLQRVRRMSDQYVLAESTSYTRIGGELTPFGMPTVSYCPSVPHDVLSAAFPR